MLIDPKNIRKWAIIANAVMLKGVLILGFGWLGSKADVSLGTSPLFMLLGLSGGTGAGLWYLFFTIKRFKL